MGDAPDPGSGPSGPDISRPGSSTDRPTPVSGSPGGGGSAQVPGGDGGSREPPTGGPTGGATEWNPVGDTWLDFPIPWIYCWAVYILGMEGERLDGDIPEWDLPTIFKVFP